MDAAVPLNLLVDDFWRKTFEKVWAQDGAMLSLEGNGAHARVGAEGLARQADPLKARVPKEALNRFYKAQQQDPANGTSFLHVTWGTDVQRVPLSSLAGRRPSEWWVEIAARELEALHGEHRRHTEAQALVASLPESEGRRRAPRL